MTEAAEKVKAALLELPLDEQLALADLIYANLPKPPGLMSEDDPGLDAMLDRRRAKRLSGEAKGVPLEELFRSIREKRQ